MNLLAFPKGHLSVLWLCPGFTQLFLFLRFGNILRLCYLSVIACKTLAFGLKRDLMISILYPDVAQWNRPKQDYRCLKKTMLRPSLTTVVMFYTCHTRKCGTCPPVSYNPFTYDVTFPQLGLSPLNYCKRYRLFQRVFVFEFVIPLSNKSLDSTLG